MTDPHRNDRPAPEATPLLDGLRAASRVLLCHAHPDDESLSTGALALDLGDHGVEVQVVTATRGERGEVVPGSLPDDFAGDLQDQRRAELALALSRLGVARHAFLGATPACAGQPRVYRDSGMQWVAEGLAGPAEDVEDDAFTLASVAEAAADLDALVAAWRPDVVVGYDLGGSYGHPDHVHLHHVARRAAADAGVRFVMVATTRQDAEEWHDFPEFLPRLRHVVAAYATQLSVEGDSLVHVGGQRQPIETWFGLAEGFPGASA
ncbi:PIG-L family deacetylase [Mariniluteicoccus flavus]